MQLNLSDLPTGTTLLHRLIRDTAGGLAHRDTEIERLRSIIKQLQRAQFGRRYERLDPDPLALVLEEIEGDIAREEKSCPPVEQQLGERSSHRKPLPDHLRREDMRLDIGEMVCCCCCGSALHVIGESVSETLARDPHHASQIRLPGL